MPGHQEGTTTQDSYLATATARLHQAAGATEEQNQRLRALIARKQALAERLRASLADAQTQRRAIEKEVQSILHPA